MIKQYLAYLKDNPKKFWFKRKLYGWGWVPVTWQGWLVIIAFILFLLLNGLTVAPNPEPTKSQLFRFFTKTIISVIVIIAICFKTGEKPRWQWGFPKKNIK